MVLAVTFIAGMPQSLPPEVDGIFGWDWVQTLARKRVEFALDEGMLRIDEATPFSDVGGTGSFRRAAFETRLVGGGELPCTEVALYGVSSAQAMGIIDTGSPLTIVSPAFADAAALFDEQVAASKP
jgi:hypothetical protein